MLKRTLLLIAALAVAAPALASDESAIGAVTNLNLVVQKATQNYDVATISKLLTDDAELVNGAGTVWDRASLLQGVGDRTAVWERNEPTDVTVRAYNGDCAVLVGILHMRYRLNGAVHDVAVRYTDVWVLLNGDWRYASGQATAIKKS